MDALGINSGLLFAQILPFVLLIGFPVISLLDLRKKNLSGTPLALWVLIICAVPIIGALAYWVIKPSPEMK